MNRHQRKGSISNTSVGNDFENLAYLLFSRTIANLVQKFDLEIGLAKKKAHRFDMGSRHEKVLIECKSHTWTESGNVPSAKITNWDQAMFYFYLAPRGWRKIFAVKLDRNDSGESLAEYYLRTHAHVIPDEVEFWEIDELTETKTRLHFDPKDNNS